MTCFDLHVYPTMITPMHSDGSIDSETLDSLVEWYRDQGCDGVFASCQSSEIWYLNEDDRVYLAKRVKRKADELSCSSRAPYKMSVVASGHVSDDFSSQVRELIRICETGVDAVILITNRMDIANSSEAAWIKDAEKLIQELPADVALGLYECPYPYKRLLTPAMLQWALSTGRFRFIKDTCCDADEIARRMTILYGSTLKLFNANAQTLLPSIRSGCSGYSGVMANFHPALYVWLMRNPNHPRAEEVADFLCLAAFTEALAYPVTAKYHLGKWASLPIGLTTKSRDPALLTPYHMNCVDRMHSAATRLLRSLEEDKTEVSI